MSLHPQAPSPIPPDTVRVALAAPGRGVFKLTRVGFLQREE